MEKEQLEWYRNAELVHGRWAMLGAAGVLTPELMTKVSCLRQLREWARYLLS